MIMLISEQFLDKNEAKMYHFKKTTTKIPMEKQLRIKTSVNQSNLTVKSFPFSDKLNIRNYDQQKCHWNLFKFLNKTKILVKKCQTVPDSGCLKELPFCNLFEIPNIEQGVYLIQLNLNKTIMGVKLFTIMLDSKGYFVFYSNYSF